MSSSRSRRSRYQEASTKQINYSDKTKRKEQIEEPAKQPGKVGAKQIPATTPARLMQTNKTAGTPLPLPPPEQLLRQAKAKSLSRREQERLGQC